MRKALVLVLILVLAAVAFGGGMELTSARLYRKQGEWAKAVEFYGKEIEKNPADLDALFERGELLGLIAADSSKLDVSRELAAGAASPKDVLIDRMLSDFAEVASPPAGADEKTVKKLVKKIESILTDFWNSYYISAVDLDSANIKAIAGGTDAAAVAHFLEEAIASLDKAIHILPEKWNAYGLKAQILDKLDRHAEALSGWLQAKERLEKLETTRKDEEGHKKALAVINARLLEDYYGMDRFDEAIVLADTILSQDSTNLEAVQYKAFALARLANDTTLTPQQIAELKTRAIHALQAARSARRNDEVIVYYLGQFYLQLGDTAQALSSFNEYVGMQPEDKDVLFALGVLYLEGGTFVNTEKARDMFRRLTELDSTNGPAWIDYGIALIRLEKLEEGKAAIAKGRKLGK